MLNSSLCDYGDVYMLVRETTTTTGAGDDAAARQTDERNKEVIFKNCAPFTGYISEINNAQVDNAKDLDVMMPMYDLIKHSDDYSKTSGNLWQYHRYEPDLDNNGNIVSFLGNSALFKFEVKLTEKSHAAGNTKDVKIAVLLKYSSNFWRALDSNMVIKFCYYKFDKFRNIYDNWYKTLCSIYNFNNPR